MSAVFHMTQCVILFLVQESNFKAEFPHTGQYTNIILVLPFLILFIGYFSEITFIMV